MVFINHLFQIGWVQNNTTAKMQSVKTWIMPVWLTTAHLNQELLALLFDQSQILSFSGHMYTQGNTIRLTLNHMQLCSSVIHSVKVSNVSVVLLTAEDGLHQLRCIQSHTFSTLCFSFPTIFFFLSPFVTFSPTIRSPYLSVLLPFLCLFLCSLLHLHRPSQTPARCVAPPPVWSMVEQAGVWGWTTTPWRGWFPRRGGMEEDADTGTGVIVPRSAPWPDTLMQTQVIHWYICYHNFFNYMLNGGSAVLGLVLSLHIHILNFSMLTRSNYVNKLC